MGLKKHSKKPTLTAAGTVFSTFLPWWCVNQHTSS
ncbi:hypothetical protein BVRB_6g136520 [Beta vulgaris subsp. vulgaris]|nr:hypothetical protein BVRB_6g136520 [Beta vulgaris subsp. vulgaris]